MSTVIRKSSSAQIAVTYCRVSSKSQTTRGDGLGSQYTRCCEYAKTMGYEVVAEFNDNFTGKSVKRPGFDELLTFIRKHKADKCVVLIDDISRLARDVESHWELRRTIQNSGGELESPSIRFKEDADSRMIENVLAGAAEHQRAKNAEQTYNRRQARLMNGYWVFAKPKGYRFEEAKGGGKILVRDEPIASIVQEALEGFACGRFGTQVEVKRFLEGQPDFPKNLANGQITNQRITDILKQPLNAGYLAAPKLGVSLRKAQHEPLISFATFEKIQQRLIDGSRAPIRKDLNSDFILRGHVACGDCNHPLTANWSKSSTGKKYPYYLCYTKECESYKKSIPREKIESEFDGIVQSMEPTIECFKMARAMFENVWHQLSQQEEQRTLSIKNEMRKVEKQSDQLLSRIVDTEEMTVIQAYEKKIGEIAKRKLILQEKLESNDQPKHTFEELFELSMNFLSKPHEIWASRHIQLRRLVLRLAFKERIAYHREKGFSNVKKSLPFNILGGLGVPLTNVVRPEGFEPPTNWFEANYSIQLSYGRIFCQFDTLLSRSWGIIMQTSQGFDKSFASE
jgi:site-specific DNA recombinase